MARIPYSPVPQAEAEGIPNDYLRIPTSPGEFGGLIAQATERAGAETQQAGADIGQVALRFQEMRNATAALDASTGASQELGALDAKFRQLSGSHAVDALPQYQEQVKAIQEKYATNLNPMAQLAFKRDFRSYADRTLMNMGVHAGEQGRQAYLTGLKANISAEQSRLVRDTVTGEPPDFSRLADRSLTLANELGLDKAGATALIQQNTGKAMHDMVMARIATGDVVGADKMFQAALKATAPDTDLPLLDADHMAALTREVDYAKMLAEHRAEVAQNRAAAVARVGLTHEISAAATIVDNGQSAAVALAPLTDKRIDAAYPQHPEIAAELKERVADLRQTSLFLANIEGKSPDQLVHMLAGVPKPDPNDPATYAERLRLNRALETALEKTEKALTTDPAAYVLAHHPDYIPMLQAAQKDPKQFGAYAQTMLASQAQMGVPEEMQHVLPAPVAASMARGIEANPEQAPAQLRAMEQNYGTAWHNVWRDLTQLGKLPAAFQAVGAIDDERQASLLARALAEPGKSGKAVADLLPAEGVRSAKKLDALVENDPAWTAFSRSLALQPGMTAAMRDQIQGAAKTLAYANLAYGAAADPNAAAAAAVKAFTGNYSYMPDGGARVPTAQMPAVTANARALLDGLDAGKVAMPGLFGKPGQPKADDYLALLKASPTWVTSPHADALWLVDNGGRIVRGKDGKPIAVPFAAPIPANPPLPAPVLTPDLRMP